MACVYYIKGRVNPFTSELELEDFLMQKGELYAKYKELADRDNKVIFGGRLGQYKYFDMDKVIVEALKISKEELN